MKLYRYELYCEEEPQDVGFLVGLQDLGLSSEKEENLMYPFDSLLEIPDLPGMRESASFFTEKGNTRFQNDIFRVAAAFQDSIFHIKCCFLDLPDFYLDAAIYRDDDQVCIPKDLYSGELASFVSRDEFPPEKYLRGPFRIVHPGMLGDLYHVGTMDITQKSRFSHEGNGLSISNCPDEWCQITEGYTHGDYFKLSKQDMKLLDFYSLTDEEKAQIKNWAIDNGYTQEGILYKSITWDEDGKEYYSLFDSHKAALEEADLEEDRVEVVAGLLPTQKLLDQSLVKVDFLDIPDIIAELYAEQVLDYDGVYWDEILDVAAYSAPRGVIFNSKISTFDVINTTQEHKSQSATNRAAESLSISFMKATNIEWDIDDEDGVFLPTEIEIPYGMEDEEEISDYLSDVTGFCHKGYQLIEVKKPSFETLIQSATARAADFQNAPASRESIKIQCLNEALEENDLKSVSPEMGREVVKQMGNGLLYEPLASNFRECVLKDHPEWDSYSEYELGSILYKDFCMRLNIHEQAISKLTPEHQP